MRWFWALLFVGVVACSDDATIFAGCDCGADDTTRMADGRLVLETDDGVVPQIIFRRTVTSPWAILNLQQVDGDGPYLKCLSADGVSFEIGADGVLSMHGVKGATGTFINGVGGTVTVTNGLITGLP